MFPRFDPFPDLRSLGRCHRAAEHRMPLDAYRRGGMFYAHIDVPGVDPGAIEVTVKGDTLTVKAERSWPEERGDEVLARERQQGTFERHVRLSEDVDRDHLQARCANGVLTLRAPVAATAKPHKVRVTVAAPPKTVEARTGEPAPTAA